MTAPVLLQIDNFTPQTRTPWGGTRIVETLKPELAPQTVGESWELSVEPDFPSRLAGEVTTLDAHIRANPDAWLGDEAADGRHSTALLVKLLNAASPLSVQIHPGDDDPLLAPGASGKPEAWYVVEAQAGAGLYIGLTEACTEARLAEAIASEGGNVPALLNFVEVQRGDFFLIGAGTPHAIGAGVTLIEPQRVLPGRRGITYRYWDWDRRYDASGVPVTGDGGTPRTLHRQDALRVTAWQAPRGAACLEACHRADRRLDLAGPASQIRLAGAEGIAAVPSDALRIDRIAGTGTLAFSPQRRLSGITVFAGTVTVSQPGTEPLTVGCGRTAAVPADFVGQLQLENAAALVSAAL